MDKQTNRGNLVVFRKSDRLLIVFVKFNSAHIKQLAMNSDYEVIVTNKEDIFHSFKDKAYVTENIEDAIPYEDIVH